MVPLQAVHQGPRFCAERSGKHTLGRAAGVPCQRAPPDQGLRIHTRAQVVLDGMFRRGLGFRPRRVLLTITVLSVGVHTDL